MATASAMGHPPFRTLCTKHNLPSPPSDLGKTASVRHLDKMAAKPSSPLIHTIGSPTLVAPPAFLHRSRISNSTPKPHLHASRPVRLHHSLRLATTLGHKHHHLRSQSTVVGSIHRIVEATLCRACLISQAPISRSHRLSVRTMDLYNPHKILSSSSSSITSACKRYDSGSITSKCRRTALQCKVDIMGSEPTLP